MLFVISHSPQKSHKKTPEPLCSTAGLVSFTSFCCWSPSPFTHCYVFLHPSVVLKKKKEEIRKKSIKKKKERKENKRNIKKGCILVLSIAKFQIGASNIYTSFVWFTTLDFQCYKPSLFSHPSSTIYRNRTSRLVNRSTA